mmetsp:Transcript_1551/g.3499  ORF Transcript_1551/g.3499 Transcript_1551/m.3499 type:complete len:274 (-) Transcript_1551:1188-2009(-)
MLGMAEVGFLGPSPVVGVVQAVHTPPRGCGAGELHSLWLRPRASSRSDICMPLAGRDCPGEAAPEEASPAAAGECSRPSASSSGGVSGSSEAPDPSMASAGRLWMATGWAFALDSCGRLHAASVGRSIPSPAPPGCSLGFAALPRPCRGGLFAFEGLLGAPRGPASAAEGPSGGRPTARRGSCCSGAPLLSGCSADMSSPSPPSGSPSAAASGGLERRPSAAPPGAGPVRSDAPGSGRGWDPRLSLRFFCFRLPRASWWKLCSAECPGGLLAW